MAEDKEDREEGGFHNPNHNNNNNNISKKGSEVKSCKGYLYYSFLRRSKNPTCVGIRRTLHQVPRNTFWETELEASKEGRSQSLFDYSCLGYSVFLNKNDSSSDQQIKRAELPVCTGFEVLLEWAQAPARVNKDDGRVLPQPQPQPQTDSPAHSTGEEYLNRFKRSAAD